jgi:SAM-dependent methyltransferase
VLLSSISCPACKERDVSFIERSGAYSIYVCRSCTMEFCDPMRGMSAHEYGSSEGYDRLRSLGSDNQESVLWWGHKQFFKDAPIFPKRGRVVKLLDVGCGTGAFVDFALKKGYDSYGIDFDEASLRVAAGSERLKDRIAHADTRDILKRFGCASIDVVTFFEVLEHVEDPRLFIGRIRELLSPDGCIAVCVPQADRRSLKYQERERADYPPNHLTRWTGKALKLFIANEGFDILAFRESPVSFGLYRRVFRGWDGAVADGATGAGSGRAAASAKAVTTFFDFAVRAKQALLAPLFSVMGMRGDRILLIARKRSV